MQCQVTYSASIGTKKCARSPETRGRVNVNARLKYTEIKYARNAQHWELYPLRNSSLPRPTLPSSGMKNYEFLYEEG